MTTATAIDTQLQLPSHDAVTRTAARQAFLACGAPAMFYEDRSEYGPVARFARRLISVVVPIDEPGVREDDRRLERVARVPDADGNVRLDHTGAPFRIAKFLEELTNTYATAAIKDAEVRYMRWTDAPISVPKHAC